MGRGEGESAGGIVSALRRRLGRAAERETREREQSSSAAAAQEELPYQRRQAIRAAGTADIPQDYPEDFRRPLTTQIEATPLAPDDVVPIEQTERGTWRGRSVGFPDSGRLISARFPLSEAPSDHGHQSCLRCDARVDPRVRARVDRVMEKMQAEGAELPREVVEPMVELAESLPRAMARRGIHLPHTTDENIIENVMYLADPQSDRAYRGTYTPPMMVFQALFGQVSMNGWNLRFDSERDYSRAVMDELAPDFSERWGRIYAHRARERAHIQAELQKRDERPQRESEAIYHVRSSEAPGLRVPERIREQVTATRAQRAAEKRS